MCEDMWEGNDPGDHVESFHSRSLLSAAERLEHCFSRISDLLPEHP